MADPGMKYSHKDEIKLMKAMLVPELALYPENFVDFVFPWGKTGTPLARKTGPRKWQRQELQQIGRHNYENMVRIENGDSPIPYNLAIASGRGPGKSALVAWLALWGMSTQIGSTTIVTANTESQLLSKTWPELGKWHTLAENGHWFVRSATTLKPSGWFGYSVKETLGIDIGYYYVQAQLWSEENPDAFAGAHNEHGMVLIMDEASGIPKPIWTVSEGFFTEPIYLRFWVAFSNPRRPQGEFYECFHKNRDFWNTRNIDSRDVEGTDKAIYQKIIDKNGEDSDEARVEVKGQFPRTGSNQLIGYATAVEASRRYMKIEDVAGSAKILGVDVARYGDDKTVLFKRQGLISFEPAEFSKLDNMTIADIVAGEIERWGADAVMIDVGGGQGVIDRLRQLGWNVFEVDSGASAERKHLYLNKRIEMWDKMSDWLQSGGVIPNHQRLLDDLSTPTYKFTPTSNKKVLESVDSIKERNLPSPDFASALAFTFAYDVAPIGGMGGRNRTGNVVDKHNPLVVPDMKC